MTTNEKRRPGGENTGAAEVKNTAQPTGESHWNCSGCDQCAGFVNALARAVGVYTVGTEDIAGEPQSVVNMVARDWLEECAVALWGEPCTCGHYHPEGTCLL